MDYAPEPRAERMFAWSEEALSVMRAHRVRSIAELPSDAARALLESAFRQWPALAPLADDVLGSTSPSAKVEPTRLARELAPELPVSPEQRAQADEYGLARVWAEHMRRQDVV